jgi:hypothetical protein
MNRHAFLALAYSLMAIVAAVRGVMTADVAYFTLTLGLLLCAMTFLELKLVGSPPQRFRLKSTVTYFVVLFSFVILVKLLDMAVSITISPAWAVILLPILIPLLIRQSYSLLTLRTRLASH